MARVAYTVVGFYMSYDDAPLWWRNYMDDKVNGEAERDAEARLEEFDDVQTVYTNMKPADDAE